jgi:hypothetical protein
VRRLIPVNQDDIVPQSSQPVVGQDGTDEVHQNVEMLNQPQDYTTAVPDYIDVTRKSQDDNTAPLAQFMSRPVRIAEYDWGVNTVLAEDFNPWALFFNNNRVSNRIANFNLMRANLHVRFIVNGNPFQYGRALAYYRPLEPYNLVDTDSALISEDLIQGSQCPRIFLDPTTSQGGELHLPFFFHKNYLRIPTAEWEGLGTIYLRSLNSLKHANGAADVMTITVLAWATDVELSVLTNLPPGTLSPQMGEFQQANKTGMISGPATVVSKVAGALKVIPWLAPYAMASEMVSSSIAKAAKIFGFSRPTVTATPAMYSPRCISSLALTNVPDNTQKFTVDAYQETTIDPRISGLDVCDELSIKSIAQRESYLTTFSWDLGTSVDTLLWNTAVDPTLYGVSGGAARHLTAICAASLPFQYWTGTINFRFQIVRSAFHKGRLRFSWDPTREIATEFNTNHMMLVDISEQDDFTMSISNGQELTLLPTGIINASPTLYYGSSPVGSGANGILSVRVLNQLTVPDTTIDNGIEINVFVSAGDDFEVFVPGDRMSELVFKPQSGQFPVLDSNTSEPSKPVQDQVMPLFSTYESPHLNKVFAGEVIASFRTLLKRYSHHHSVNFAGTGNAIRSVLHRIFAFPYFRGNVPGAIDKRAVDDPYNYCNTTLLNYLMPAFAGWKGSLRWKVMPAVGLNATSFSAYATRTRASDQFGYLSQVLPYPTGQSPDQAVFERLQNAEFIGSVDVTAVPHGLLGTAFTNHTNTALEVEIPWYSRFRFCPTKLLDYTSLVGGAVRPPTWMYRADFSTIFGAEPAVFDFHVAAGDDFQFYFWTGMPRVYVENSFPNPKT